MNWMYRGITNWKIVWMNKRRVSPFRTTSKENSLSYVLSGWGNWNCVRTWQKKSENTWSKERWKWVRMNEWELKCLSKWHWRLVWRKLFHFTGYKMTNCVTFHGQKNSLILSLYLFSGSSALVVLLVYLIKYYSVFVCTTICVCVCLWHANETFCRCSATGNKR